MSDVFAITVICVLFSVAMFLDRVRQWWWTRRQTRHTRALIREMNEALDRPSVEPLWQQRRKPVRPFDYERDGV